MGRKHKNNTDATPAPDAIFFSVQTPPGSRSLPTDTTFISGFYANYTASKSSYARAIFLSCRVVFPPEQSTTAFGTLFLSTPAWSESSTHYALPKPRAGFIVLSERDGQGRRDLMAARAVDYSFKPTFLKRYVLADKY